MLDGPFEILELGDRQSIELTVQDFILGDIMIHPRFAGAPAEKRIHGLRIVVPMSTKPIGPNYYDITSQTLIVQMQPFLSDLKSKKGKVKITAFGFAPSKRFTVEML